MEGRWTVNEPCLAASAPTPLNDLCSHIPDRKVGRVDVQLPMSDARMHCQSTQQQRWINVIFNVWSQSVIDRHETCQFGTREAVGDKRPHRLTQSSIGRAIRMNSVPLSPERLDVDSGQMIDKWQPELQSNKLMGYPMIFNVLRGK